MRRDEQHAFLTTTLFISGALLVWLGTFSVVYIFAALACAKAFANSTALWFADRPRRHDRNLRVHSRDHSVSVAKGNSTTSSPSRKRARTFHRVYRIRDQCNRNRRAGSARVAAARDECV